MNTSTPVKVDPSADTIAAADRMGVMDPIKRALFCALYDEDLGGAGYLGQDWCLRLTEKMASALSHIDSLSTPVQVNKAIPSMDSILAEMAGETAPVQGEVEELRKQVAEWSALATINNTLWQARAETAEASAAALKLRVVELEVALRPFADAEGVVQACASQGVPLFLKQLGAAPTSAGRRIILPHHSNHNDDPQHWPDKFRVQRFPEAA